VGVGISGGNWHGAVIFSGRLPQIDAERFNKASPLFEPTSEGSRIYWVSRVLLGTYDDVNAGRQTDVGDCKFTVVIFVPIWPFAGRCSTLYNHILALADAARC
jgi:hypothetical protein